MGFYFCLAFIIYLFSIYDISIERNALKSNIFIGKSIYYLIVFTLITLGGIRWLTGTDWNPYYNFFNNHKTWDEYNSIHFEFLYTLLNFFVHQISNSYTIFLFIFSFLVIYIKAITIKKIALYPALSLYLFYCTNIGDIFAVRQMLAGSLLLMSIYFIHKKEKKAFYFILILATLIHYSSIFWLFSYYVYHKKINNIYIGIIIVVSVAVGLMGGAIYPIIIQTIFKPFDTMGIAIPKILIYSIGVDSGYSPIKAVVSIIKRLLFIPFFLVFKKQIINTNKYVSGILNIYCFGNIIYLFFSFYATTFQRMTSPYIFTEIFLLPVCLKIIKRRYIKYIFLFMLLIYGFLKLYMTISPFTDILVPYYSIFNYKNRIMY